MRTAQQYHTRGPYKHRGTTPGSKSHSLTPPAIAMPVMEVGKKSAGMPSMTKMADPKATKAGC